MGETDYLVRFPFFYDSSLMHDQDSVAEGLDQGQIVADKEVGEGMGRFQLFQQLIDMVLY